MGIETVSLIIASFVSGSLGIAALMRNFRSSLSVCFALLCAALFAHDALCVVESFDSVRRFSSPRLHAMAILLVGPTALMLLRTLVHRWRGFGTKLVFAYLPLLVFFIVLTILPMRASVGGWLHVLVHLLFVVPAFIILYVLAKSTQQATLTRERLRLRYAFWGAAITVAFFTTDALQFVDVPVPPLGTLARTLF
ncbi:MAG: hypothetical protein HY537_04020, partial [Deltaproteobacteria bacterium]|nr:hypothetical protein [Deltaproteobacteria bacterium]